MSIADQVADLRRLIADTASRADAVWDESPEQGRALFESAARDKAFLDRILGGDPEAVAQAEQWDDDPPGGPNPSPSEDLPPVTTYTCSNGLPGGGTYCEDTPEASEAAKQRIMEAVGFWVYPADTNVAQPIVIASPRSRSAGRPREHRSGRRQATRGSPSDDPDLDPPVTRFQRALRAARGLDWQETADLVDHLLIRLERWSR